MGFFYKCISLWWSGYQEFPLTGGPESSDQYAFLKCLKIRKAFCSFIALAFNELLQHTLP
jgi:hypothetical protein